MVTGPTAKNVCCTEEVKERKGGAARFIGAKTGDEGNIQNSEIKEVSKEEFKTAVGKKEHIQGWGRWEENLMEPRANPSLPGEEPVGLFAGISRRKGKTDEKQG